MKSRKLFFILSVSLLFLGTAASAQNFKYIGAVKCKMCHDKPEKGEQYTKWMDGPHSKAYEALKEDKDNETCLKCHSTAGSVDKSLLAGIKVNEGVSCETCHGPGSAYKTNSIMKNKEMALAKGMVEPTEATCKACHTAKKPEGHPDPKKPWNFAEFSKEIAHPNPQN
jgi:hypothetical protein